MLNMLKDSSNILFEISHCNMMNVCMEDSAKCVKKNY